MAAQRQESSRGSQNSVVGQRSPTRAIASRSSTSEERSEGPRMTDRLSYTRGLVLHLAVPALLGISMGLLQAEAARAALAVPPEVLALAGAGLMGVLSGLSARSLLRGWMPPARLVLGLTSVLIWLVAAEIAYYATHIVNPGQALAPPNVWTEIGQLAMGLLGLLAAYLVARRTRQPAGIVWVYTAGSVAPAPRPRRSAVSGGIGIILLAAILLGIGAGLLQANVAQLSFAVPPIAIPLIGAGVMGIVAGLAARLALQGWREGVRVLAALLALLVWILAGEVAVGAFAGRNVLSVLETTNSWAELGQLAIGLQAAVVAGLGRRLVPSADPALALLRATAPAPPPARTGRRRVRPGVRARAARPRRRDQAQASRRRRRKAKTPQVRVLALEEERCPYCLGLIEDSRSRDVVRCRICGTPHHADCWREGGEKCQVPHLLM